MHLLANRFGHTDTMKRCLFVMMLLAWGALAQPVPRFRWQNFTKAEGLPDDRVYNVAVDGTRVWAATENGLGLYENGTWRVFRPEDGLAHRVATYVAVDKNAHDVWIATMRGLSRSRRRMPRVSTAARPFISWFTTTRLFEELRATSRREPM